ncbi:MAG TPA: hypothetical protein ENK85_08815 [Saprospiraceae bacterium]|nr:hypothetical protein [Saprospiraceae bacterium]
MKKNSGITNTINEILANLGYEREDCYVASNLWELRSGSAHISIAYDEDSGFIFGDAALGSLPENPSNDLLIFLLSQNNEPGKIRLALKGEVIMLSWTAYDKYFSQEAARTYIEEHLKEADRLDNILVAKYGCTWSK